MTSTYRVPSVNCSSSSRQQRKPTSFSNINCCAVIKLDVGCERTICSRFFVWVCRAIAITTFSCVRTLHFESERFCALLACMLIQKVCTNAFELSPVARGFGSPLAQALTNKLLDPQLQYSRSACSSKTVVCFLAFIWSKKPCAYDPFDAEFARST